MHTYIHTYIHTFPEDLVTFAEEIVTGKPNFFVQ